MAARGFTKLGKVDRDGRHHWFAEWVISPVIRKGDILFLNGHIVEAVPHPHFGFEFARLVK